jgi:hypothetical protein
MLTIKAVYSPNHEEIFEAKSVRTVPVEVDPPGLPCINVLFTHPDDHGEMAICTKDCAVYVMNDKGRTISNYY